MAVAGVFPNHLSLVFHYGYKRCNDDDRGNWHANFSFDYIHYWWKELKNQALPRACWKNCKNILALVNEIQANFLLITKRFDIQEMFDCVVCSSFNREFKIRRLRTTTTDKHATAHDQNHVTVHFSPVVLRLRWVVELFRVVGTTENILLVFCRLGNSRISSFCKKVFNSPALSEREAKYVSCV